MEHYVCFISRETSKTIVDGIINYLKDHFDFTGFTRAGMKAYESYSNHTNMSKLILIYKNETKSFQFWGGTPLSSTKKVLNLNDLKKVLKEQSLL